MVVNNEMTKSQWVKEIRRKTLNNQLWEFTGFGWSFFCSHQRGPCFSFYMMLSAQRCLNLWDIKFWKYWMTGCYRFTYKEALLSLWLLFLPRNGKREKLKFIFFWIESRSIFSFRISLGMGKNRWRKLRDLLFSR